jgi:hypothetical protein
MKTIVPQLSFASAYWPLPCHCGFCAGGCRAPKQIDRTSSSSSPTTSAGATSRASDGDWKPLTDDAKRRELYRIADDRAEQNNVANEHPDIVKKLSAQLDAWKASLPKEPPAEFIANRRKAGKATGKAKND